MFKVNMQLIIACFLCLVLGFTYSVHAYSSLPTDSFSLYHTTDKLISEYNALSASCKILNVTSETLNGKTIHFANINGGDEKVSMFFGEHARELVSPELGLEFTRMLCGKAKYDKVSNPSEILSRFSFQFAIVANPTGRKFAEKGRYCHRTTANEVDLNRNWDIHWESGGAAEVNPGHRAFSEPETNILKNALTNFKPSVFISVHSGSEALFSPFAYTKSKTLNIKTDSATLTKLSNSRVALDKAHVAIKKEFCKNCKTGNAAKILGYTSPGNCMDYAFEKLLIPYSMAIEIYDGYKSGKKFKSSLVEIVEESLADLELSDASYEDEEDSEDELSFLAIREEYSSSFSPLDPFYNDQSFLEVEAEEEDLDTEEVDAADLEEVLLENKKDFPVGVNNENKDCAYQFNPLGPKAYSSVVATWSNALAKMLSLLPAGNP